MTIYTKPSLDKQPQNFDARLCYAKLPSAFQGVCLACIEVVESVPLERVVDGGDVAPVPHLYLHTRYTLLSLLVAPTVGHPGSHTMALTSIISYRGEVYDVAMSRTGHSVRV